MGPVILLAILITYCIILSIYITTRKIPPKDPKDPSQK